MFLENIQKELIKKSINDYNFMKMQFELNKDNFKSFEDIENWLNKYKGIDIRCIDGDEYLDFEYNACNLSISKIENGFSLSKCYEIYDSVNMEYIVEDFLTNEEYIKLLNTEKEEMLASAIATLKYYESRNMKVDYDRYLEKIIVFLKENW